MAASEITLTSADHGGTVTVRPGDVIAISLEEDPTTGFRWVLDRNDEDSLEAVGSNYLPAQPSGAGGTGQHVFRFKAARAGQVRLALKRWRQWEGDRSIVGRFEITVRIAGP